jgi:signal transduction histidine kinase
MQPPIIELTGSHPSHGFIEGNMSRWPYPGIRTRIIGPFLAVILLVAGIGVFTVTRLVAGSIQERFSNQLADSASAASNSIVEIERQQLSTLRLLVFTEGVPDALSSKDTSLLEQYLRPVVANAGIDDVIVFDGTGQGIFQLQRVENETGTQYLSLTPPPLKDWQSVERIISASTDSLGDKFVDVIGRAPNGMLYVSAPVVDKSDHVIGGISVGLTTSRIARRVSAQSLSAVTLFAMDGRVLGSTFQVAPDTLALSSERMAALRSAMQTITPLEQMLLDNVPYQALYAPLEVRSQRVGLLAVALPSNFIVERSSTSRDVFGVLFSGLFVSVAVLGLGTARTITGPVGRLVNTTRAIREGDLSRRVELRTPDELGELGVSFDHMTDQLVQRNIEINALYHQQVQETARRDAVLSSISDAVIVQDLDGKTILQNPTADRLIEALQHNPDQSLDFAALCQWPADLVQPRTMSFAGRFFSVLATPVCLESGDLLGHVIVFRDITAIVEAENLKDEMIMQMSHELRTPLTAARGYVDLAKMLGPSAMNQQASEFIGVAANNLTTLERMVNQVIDVSSLISNRFTLNFITFDLARMLHEQVAAWKPMMDERELTLSLLTAPPSLQIEADSHWIAQVTNHLIRNAHSYTLPGGSIDIRATMSDTGVSIVVTDDGAGIGPDEIDHVFDRMFRGRAAEAGPTDARGLGLGLYVSKQIVEAHHGTIRLDSELGKGTTVTIDLPLKQGNR